MSDYVDKKHDIKRDVTSLFHYLKIFLRINKRDHLADKDSCADVYTYKIIAQKSLTAYA